MVAAEYESYYMTVSESHLPIIKMHKHYRLRDCSSAVLRQPVYDFPNITMQCRAACCCDLGSIHR